MERDDCAEKKTEGLKLAAPQLKSSVTSVNASALCCI